MAATTQNQTKSAKIIPFPRPVKGRAAPDQNKRLPDITSADIEDFFAHADARTMKTRRAA